MMKRGSRTRGPGQRKRKTLRPKNCRFCEDGLMYIDFKDLELLTRYVTEMGRILPRRVTGTCPWHQKMLTRAVKWARDIALIA